MKINSKTLKWCIQIAGTVVLLYFTIKKVDKANLVNVLNNLSIMPLLFVPFILIVDLLINSARIKSLYSLYYVDTKVKDIFMIRLQGLFFSLAVPYLGDAFTVYNCKSLYGEGYQKHTIVIFLDRLIFTLGLILLVAPVWLFSIIAVSWLYKVGVLILLLINLVLIHAVNNSSLLKAINSISQAIFKKHAVPDSMHRSNKEYYVSIFSNTAVAVLRHSLIAVLYVIIAYALVHSFHFDVVGFILVVFSIMLSRVIPASVGGIGLREYLAVMILPQVGISEDFAFSIAFFISLIVVIQGVIGGIVFMFRKLVTRDFKMC
ncbi:MAG: lysylphosphatidylglycerol synthase transmembrane domain-containing protein [Candidatus Cloacimonadaceae bacterium]|nr:lysylphosphatidylglycerol synthase transmembrane domain-containing protein [Candidatus Cloacimonadota bacterium]MDY0299474.1 lysylphosphatidylglycerol synthase transmembrane domain-containing protein [Candidatus Cloacimonadaceae bacterium]